MRIAKSSITLALFLLISCKPTNTPITFNSKEAWQHLVYQVELGPRPVGSAAHAELVNYISETLDKYGWVVEIRRDVALGHQIQNIVGKRGEGDPLIILGAHYDTRLVADNDSNPEFHSEPVIGANDGASGAAILLEFARIIPADINGAVWLVFFDGEDNGNILGWDWILGSTSFVENLVEEPTAVVILDMVADKDLNIHIERNSNQQLSLEIWAKAEELGYSDYFISSKKYSMLDDHTPFLRRGIPAVDIIDFDYPHWHTTQDNINNVSAESLAIVGETVLAWLLDIIK